MPKNPDKTGDATPHQSTGTKRASLLRSLLTGGLLSVLILVGLAYFGYSRRDVILAELAAHIPQNSGQDAVAMQAQIERQAADIKRLQAQIEKLTKAPVTTPVDDNRLSELEASLGKLRQEVISPQELQEMRDQMIRLGTISQSIGQQLQLQQEASKARPDLRLLAIFQLMRAKAMEGAAFQDSLQRFLALSSSYPHIQSLAQKLEIYASSGRPSAEDMRTEFDTVVKDYLKERDGVDSSFGGKVKRNLAEFITIRKTGTAGNSPIASINRAQRALQSGNVGQALTELEELSPEDQPFFAAWMEEARAYVAIPSLLLKLDRQLADVLMQSSAERHAS